MLNFYFLHRILLVIFLQIGYSVHNGAEASLWLPDGMSLEDWKQCNGLSPDDCKRFRLKLQQFKQKISGGLPPESIKYDESGTDPQSFSNTLDGCIIPTEEQLDRILQSLSTTSTSQQSNPARRKRTISDFKISPQSKWSLPIHYKFDESYNNGQKTIIRNALQHWMDNTCVRFKELSASAAFNSYHIVITSNDTQFERCSANVGRSNRWPQRISLHDSCLMRFGTVVHEIGHALGLWHEQNRRDSDSWINVQKENIIPGYESIFWNNYTTDTLGLPFEFNSVMLYSPLEGVSVNGREAMLARNPLYQQNMGQRTGISFGDRQAINIAYCQGSVCTYPLSRPCGRGGYQDPNDCSRCICPDGFSGTFCENVAPSSNADCGGTLTLQAGSEQIIYSPGYQNPRNYWSYQACNWLVKAPTGFKVTMRFDGEFGLYCVDKSCYHWVEVKYKADLGLEGGRFCCYSRPTVQITSESAEMMITFRSNFSVNFVTAQRGFKIIVTTVPDSEFRTTTTSTTSTTKLPPTTQPSVDGSDRVDLALLIDSTSQIDSSGWTATRYLIADLLRRLDVKVGADQVATVTFGSLTEIVSPLSPSYDLELILAALARGARGWLPGSLSLAPALGMVRSRVFGGEGSSRDRPDAANVCLVVILGDRPVGDVPYAISETMEARREGLRVVMVTSLRVMSRAHAESIAGSKNYVFFIDDLISGQNLTEAFQSPNSPSASIIGSFKSSSSINRDIIPSELWQCSFEVGGQIKDPMCGMTQETTDQFDWTIYSGATPSDPTGPDNAYHGFYYIYIEASEPRKPDDVASLLFPSLSPYRGPVCLDFYYHMFGFHVRSLWVSKELEDGSRSIVWRKDKEKGNAWLRAAIDLTLQPNSRLRIAASRGDEFSGDIALDRIRITSGQCI